MIVYKLIHTVTVNTTHYLNFRTEMESLPTSQPQSKRVIIRIQFPDQTTLQGSFLRNFVREYLEDQQMEFYLCKCKLIYDNVNIIRL